MARLQFTLDEDGLERLLSSNQAEDALRARAEDVQREWERGDPRQKPGGHAAPKIEIGSPERERGVAVVPVYTTDSFWHIIEYGSANTPPERPATRAARAAGLDFQDDR